MKKVRHFLDVGLRNQWIEYPGMIVYVREAHHYHPGLKQVIKCFDVASVYVNKPNKGTFTTWFNALRKELSNSKFSAIFVESVINPSFADYLRRRNLYEVGETMIVPANFFLMLDKQGGDL